MRPHVAFLVVPIVAAVMSAGCRSREVYITQNYTGVSAQPPLSPEKPQIAAGRPDVLALPKCTSVCCWYVKYSPDGKFGYAAADSRVAFIPPGGGGIFETLDDLENRLFSHELAVDTIIPAYPGSVPAGWTIRGLTPGEARELRAMAGDPDHRRPARSRKETPSDP